MFYKDKEHDCLSTHLKNENLKVIYMKRNEDETYEM